MLAAVSALWNQNLGTVDWWVRLAMTVVIGALAVVLAGIRVRREQELRHMTAIAEAAQRALLRAMPSSIGSLGFAARYVSATEEALVGGDLYEVAETPDGVRVIVGDVRGKGLDAVQMAATVLAAFRRAAVMEPSLTAVATDLDNVVTAVAGDEDFVTAVLAEFHDDLTVTLVNCGHHPPLLLTETPTPAGWWTPATPAAPGARPVARAGDVQLPDGARLLFYTDGLVETRNRQGAFFPLARHRRRLCVPEARRRAGRPARPAGRPRRDEIDDDMALLLVERHTLFRGRVMP